MTLVMSNQYRGSVPMSKWKGREKLEIGADTQRKAEESLRPQERGRKSLRSQHPAPLRGTQRVLIASLSVWRLCVESLCPDSNPR